MKTLVIHPTDDTTDFLIPIYRDKGYTIITERDVNRDYIRESINDHDRIIMLGHGSTDGLFGGNPLGTRYKIDSSLAPLLRTKDTVCIWCNANVFVEKYKLPGFYTGMMISELGEAIYCGVTATQEEIDYSNKLFSRSVREAIHCLSFNNMQYLAKSCYRETLM